ncbi:hypothetical protein ACFQH6_09305 [Halobacteriaceae archaeon GCM10025711]
MERLLYHLLGAADGDLEAAVRRERDGRVHYQRVLLDDVHQFARGLAGVDVDVEVEAVLAPVEQVVPDDRRVVVQAVEQRVRVASQAVEEDAGRVEERVGVEQGVAFYGREVGHQPVDRMDTPVVGRQREGEVPHVCDKCTRPLSYGGDKTPPSSGGNKSPAIAPSRASPDGFPLRVQCYRCATPDAVRSSSPSPFSWWSRRRRRYR